MFEELDNEPINSHRFVRVHFHNFKAFKSFEISLRRFNILVGPNNAGKSTVLAAFRILAAAIRKARAKRPEIGPGPQGKTWSYSIDLRAISIGEENIFYDYNDEEPAIVTFSVSNGNKLILYFPKDGGCFMIPESTAKPVRTTKDFKSCFDCQVGYVPILGPVDHNEQLYERETARNSLFSYGAARNIRNIWYYYPQRFNEFRDTLRATWPGMDIEKPTLDSSHEKPVLHMFCPEDRIPRELFWAGFGFQVWCQMLTFLVQSKHYAIFMIDEPDIYLHSVLQRQLVHLLKDLGPDILIATHSTEILREAEAEDILLVDKREPRARRIKRLAQLESVFELLGSNMNPVFTQIAKSKRVLFLEGNDYKILSKIAQKLNAASVGYQSDFAVLPVEGFNPDRVRSIKTGIELALGSPIRSFVVFDRDYRCGEQCEEVKSKCLQFCDYVHIHSAKEIENYLLVPEALNRAVAKRLHDRAMRDGGEHKYTVQVESFLEMFLQEQKPDIIAQQMASYKQFHRFQSSGIDDTTTTSAFYRQFEDSWSSPIWRRLAAPGKSTLSSLNEWLNREMAVSLSVSFIIQTFHASEIHSDLKDLIHALQMFATGKSVDN